MLIHIDPGSDLWVTEFKVGKVEPPGDHWTLAAITEGKMIWKRSKVYADADAVLAAAEKTDADVKSKKGKKT